MEISARTSTPIPDNALTRNPGYHFHFRQYDADAGVWITPDPIGILGGLNLYQYAGSNPVNVVDWLGLVSAGELGVGNPGSYGR